MKAIEYTWDMAASEVTANTGLNESDEGQFYDAVNREIGESRYEIEDDEDLPPGFQYC